MPRIELKTEIRANKKLVFDLSRSVDLHEISTKHTNEKAIAGRTSGLIELNETVTWQANHFGVDQKLTSKITEYNSPEYFVDEMVDGIFKELRHEHHFSDINDGTMMIDYFDYKSPLGILGKFADFLFLKGYLRRLLVKRNEIIRDYAESENWKLIVKE